MLLCFGSISAVRVLFSLYALSLGAQPSAVGVLFATFYVFPLLLSWPVGMLSDRIGARWLLLLSTLISIVAMLLPFWIRELPVLYLSGMLLGLSISVHNVSLHNVVGILSKPDERARNFSNASLTGSITAFLGPLITGFAIDYAGHAMACLYIAVIPLVAALLLAIWGHVLPGGSRHSVPWRAVRATLADRGILRILGLSSLVQVGQDLFYFYIPIHGYGLGLSASAIGSVLAAFAVAEFLVRFIMPRLVAWLGEEPLLAYSFALAAVSFVAAPLCESAVTLAAATFLFGFGMGCGHPITTMLIFGRSSEGRSGETFGLRQTVNNLARVGAPPIFGLIAAAVGLLPVFWINALMMGVGSWLSRSSGTHPPK